MQDDICADAHSKITISISGDSAQLRDFLAGDAMRSEKNETEEREKRYQTEDRLSKVQADYENACKDNGRYLETIRNCDDRLRDSNNTIFDQERTIRELRREIDNLKAEPPHPASKLTDEQIGVLAAKREEQFQEALDSLVQLPGGCKPRTMLEFFNTFVFPIFRDGSSGNYGTCGNKIAMIKQLREVSGAGLKDSKDFIEGIKPI